MRPYLGATFLEDGRRCRFLVWAPWADAVDLRIVAPHEHIVRLDKIGKGYHQMILADIDPAVYYVYRLHGQQSAGSAKERPDPASRYQPQGVHGPSQVVFPDFDWADADWHGLPLSQYIIYELHVGAFTPEGTFDAAIPYLDRLTDTGITAVDLMPVAQFPAPVLLPPSIHTGDRKALHDWLTPATARDWRWCWMWFTTTWGRKATISKTSDLISPIFIKRPGAKPLISTVPTATRFAAFLLKARCTGCATVISMRSESMPCTPF
jgi:hypothetical protein